MKVIVNGVATEYRDEGAGDVVLMLHGWQDSLASFDPIVALLAGKCRIVRPDLPGFGGSEVPSAPWKLDDYVAFVDAFTRKLNISPRCIVGHSFGGRIAIRGVSSRALRPEKLVLIAAAGLARRGGPRAAALKAIAAVGGLAALPLPAALRRTLRDQFYRRIKSDYAGAGVMRPTFRFVIAEELSSAASSISIPTLIIWGSADAQTPLEEGVRLSRLVKDSRFELFQAAGHFVHREHAPEVVDLIASFI